MTVTKHRYLFIEIPLTASWAIRHELCEFYGGEPILHKHASYPEFCMVARSDEKRYFVFATVRNPLDEAVSHYFKLKTNHHGIYTSMEALNAGLVDRLELEKFHFIRQTGADFESFFLRYFRRPFSSMIDFSRGHLDFVIRYENLQSDYASVLNQLGLELVRTIPVINQTESRCPDWQVYYTPVTIELARRKFWPFMRRWGYELPPEWGGASQSWQDERAYQILAHLRQFYFLHIRNNPRTLARLAKQTVVSLVR